MCNKEEDKDMVSPTKERQLETFKEKNGVSSQTSSRYKKWENSPL